MGTLPPDEVKDCFPKVGSFGLGIEAQLRVCYMKSEDKGHSKHRGCLCKRSQNRNLRSDGY